MKRVFRILAIIGLIVGGIPILLIVLTWLFARTDIVVHNGSTKELTNVVVSGNGFKERIPKIRAGGTYTLSQHPSGKTGISVAFDADGQHFDLPEDGYAGATFYTCRVEISPSLAVQVRC